jgi:hypothetical protein
MRRHPGLFTTENARLLLLVVSAGSSRRVCRSRRGAAVEETHGGGDVEWVVVCSSQYLWTDVGRLFTVCSK